MSRCLGQLGFPRSSAEFAAGVVARYEKGKRRTQCAGDEENRREKENEKGMVK